MGEDWSKRTSIREGVLKIDGGCRGSGASTHKTHSAYLQGSHWSRGLNLEA